MNQPAIPGASKLPVNQTDAERLFREAVKKEFGELPGRYGVVFFTMSRVIQEFERAKVRKAYLETTVKMEWNWDDAIHGVVCFAMYVRDSGDVGLGYGTTRMLECDLRDLLPQLRKRYPNPTDVLSDDMEYRILPSRPKTTLDYLNEAQNLLAERKKEGDDG